MDTFVLGDEDTDRQRFALDIWEVIISFITDDQRPTLINLSYVSRDLCITLRRRLFRKVIFALSHNPSHTPPNQLAEPLRSPCARLIPILKSNPVLSEYIRQLEIRVTPNSAGDVPRVKETGYYDDYSLPDLVPYLRNLDVLLFTSQSVSAVRWSTLPALVRSTLHPLLRGVTYIKAPDLYDLPSSIIFDSRTTPLHSLSVGMHGLFVDGRRFSADTLHNESSECQHRRPQTMIRSLTIDSRCDFYHWIPFPHWLIADNPAFPISVNCLEELTFVHRQHLLGPKHGFQKLLERCAANLRSLRLPPGYNIEEAMRAKLTWRASQWMHFKGKVPDLSSLTNLKSCQITVSIRSSGDDYFTTTLPSVMKTLATLPANGDGTKGTLTELLIDLYLQDFEDQFVKYLDWSQFVGFIIRERQFRHLERVVIAVVCLSLRNSSSRSRQTVKVDPSTLMMHTLRTNPALKRLIDSGLLHIVPDLG